MTGLPLPLDPSVRGADNCGCCEGTGTQTPQEIWNRGGLAAIQYRIGTHGSFKASMLTRLSAPDVPALNALTTRDDSDPTIALLDAAAVMADVITFYQERIANESYLATATEWRSLAALGRLTGYEPAPGVAATAFVAFTLETGTGAPEATAVPAGTALQSVPAAGQLPQTFETLAPFTARPEWNAMPVVRTRPQAPPVGDVARSILVQGIASQIRIGDRLLLTDGQGGGMVQTVFAVMPDLTASTTRIDFTASPHPPLGMPLPALPPAASPTTAPVPLTRDALAPILTQAWDGADLLAFVQSMKWSMAAVMSAVMAAAAGSSAGALRFRQKAAVFGHNAPAWATLPAELRVGAGAQETLVGGIFAGGTPGNATITAATITGATIVGATVTGVANVIAFQPGQPVGAIPITGQAVAVLSGAIVPPAPNLIYGSDWDNPHNTTLDRTWIGNALLPATGDQAAAPNTVIALDHGYTGIGVLSWVVLDDATTGATLFGQINQVADVSLVGFTLSAKVTEIDLGQGADLSPLTRRGTSVFCDNEVLTLAPVPVSDPVGGSVLWLDRIYLGLQAGQVVAVSGQRLDLPGVTGTELATLAAVTVAGNLTMLTLTRPLAFSYAAASVAINANVVLATHGKSVAETLGSGDATKPFQEFALRQAPLTFVADPAGGGARTTLQIRVNGESWSEVDSLFGAVSTDRVYVTWLADNGQTHILFGDGAMGARLPTGAATVTATYRTGLGTQGLVAAQAVSLLLTRPLGVRNASNPVATTDAADAETPVMLRQSAPLHVLTLDRVVSLADYGNFALAYPGVGKALASWGWAARGRNAVLTVAGPDGAVVDPAGPLAVSLITAIRAAGDPAITVSLADYQPVFFQVGVAVKSDPALLRGTVLAAVEAVLRTAFAFAQRDFGQDVVASEVVAAIQGVPGVLACDLTMFCRPPQQTGVADVLRAATPRPGATDPPPAEILLLDPRPIAFEVLP